jgi:hypothetical protein
LIFFWEGGRPFIDEAEVEDVICCRIKVHLNFAMTWQNAEIKRGGWRPTL